MRWNNGLFTMLWQSHYQEFPTGSDLRLFSSGSSLSSSSFCVICCCICCCAANCVCWFISICNCWLIDTGNWIFPRDGNEVSVGILVTTLVIAALDAATDFDDGVSGSPFMMGPPTPALSIAALSCAMERTGNERDDGVETPGSRLKINRVNKKWHLKQLTRHEMDYRSAPH